MLIAILKHFVLLELPALHGISLTRLQNSIESKVDVFRQHQPKAHLARLKFTGNSDPNYGGLPLMAIGVSDIQMTIVPRSVLRHSQSATNLMSPMLLNANVLPSQSNR